MKNIKEFENKIICGDVLEIVKEMPDKSIDCVITDPPYGINYQSNMRIDKTKRHKKIDNDKAPFVWFLYDSFRIIKAGGFIIVFCRWDTEHAFRMAIEQSGFQIKSQVIWDRIHHGMGDLKSSFAPCHDTIWFAVKGNFKFPHKRPKSIISCQRISGNKLQHPNEKPTGLLKYLMEYTTKEKDLILDPFMGSGTTALVARQLGRNFIGIELNPDYIKIANNRLK